MLKVEPGIKSLTACRHSDYCCDFIKNIAHERRYTFERLYKRTVTKLNKGCLFWWLKKRRLGKMQSDGQKNKRERLGTLGRRKVCTFSQSWVPTWEMCWGELGAKHECW
ncbi:hypothetical protein QQF64_026661 [Cirrhinus molitorella]|uniref:Uncharacterized protein n=1 Tax=Cirrhinus molitorella TaxID=172907 RepID=A0ABR3NAG0_9TELE